MNAKLAVAFLPFVCNAALAQEQGVTDSALETVVVTGSRAPAEISEIAASVSVVDEARLRQQLSIDTNVLSTLDALVPGLTVSQGEFRNGCRMNIRGRAAQFLINGVPTNDNLRRSTCGSLFGLSPHAVERIEVVRGSTALYGAGAPGGVINLITRKARSSDLEADLLGQWSFNPHERDDSGERKPLVITQNGEAKAVIQDVVSYEETQETLALLKILALGNKQVAEGKVKPVGEVVKRLCAQRKAD